MKTNKIRIRTTKIFDKWEIDSCVRNRPYRYHVTNEDFKSQDSKNWFPSDLLPFLKSSHISNLSSEKLKALQASYLVHFLDYTTELEHSLVNRAVENIVHNKTGVDFSKQLQDIGLKIYTDEAYHALFSAELSNQISQHFKIKRHSSKRIKRLQNLICQSTKAHKGLAIFLVAFVSETIIAKELLDLSRYNLIDPVSHMFRDHLHDEARHSQYFSDCFVWLWESLDYDKRLLCSQLIPNILSVFSEFDEPWLQKELLAHNVPQRQVEILLQETQHWSLTRLKLISTNTLYSIRRTDLLKNPEFQRLFEEGGVLP